MPYVFTALIGLVGGISSGLFGVGGGTIFVPLLILGRGMDAHMAIGTSLAVVIPTALMGAIRHGKAGMIDWQTVCILLVLSMLGAWLGASLSLKLDTLLLKRLFAIFLLVVAVKIFFSN